MSNILQALLNIAEKPVTALKSHYSSRNTINNVGEALETYIQDAFAGTISEKNIEKRNEKISCTFSYLGNQNNPPDMILAGGDAIEVKKIQSYNSAIALNSSYPKNKLYADDHKITTACRTCEEWDIKDIIYAIGVASDTELKHLWLLYGDCYAADREIYTRIGKTIHDGVTQIPDIEFAETKELGRVNRVDPLGITDLRIRGMWHIDNPNKTFNYIYTYDDTKNFQLICLMKKEKYESLPSEDREAIENIENNNVKIQDIRIKNPNNPVQLIDAKLLIFKV